jgi:hypothetical protein
MSLAEGVLVLWSDTLPEVETAWRAWHVREHMPDRMTISGMRLGRRYRDPAAARHQTFMMYEADDVEIFRSAAYLAQMNEPSEETRRLLPFIRNILRGVCRTLASESAGIGEVLATVRVGLEAPERLDRAVAAELVRTLRRNSGITGAHVLTVDRAVTGIPTTEQKLRHDAGDVLDGLVLIEGSNRADVGRAAQAVAGHAALATLKPGVMIGVYDLVYLLSAKTAG